MGILVVAMVAGAPSSRARAIPPRRKSQARQSFLGSGSCNAAQKAIHDVHARTFAKTSNFVSMM
jgi:hypothetical protein